MPAVDVRLVDVVKRFGDAVAVDHIDLEVHDGEFFSLLGPSGCGKTTTLRMIGGFEEPTAGLIELQGEDVTWLPPYKRNVNTVFQNYALFPHLTIYENVAFGLRRKGVQDAEVKAASPRCSSSSSCPATSSASRPRSRAARRSASRSRGRSSTSPAVLLLDEPLGALDLKLRKQMQVELKRIQQEVGITFIYVTHDQEEAMTMSDRIAVMNHGRYEQLGDPEGLYERPTTRFVAGFLGVSNLLPGAAEGTDGVRRVQAWPTTPSSARRARWSAGRPGRIGVRPEKIRLRETDEDIRPGTTGSGRRARRLLPRRQHPVPGRGARTAPPDRLRAERRTRHQGRALDHRRGGPPVLVAGPQLRRRRCRPRRPAAEPAPEPAAVV